MSRKFACLYLAVALLVSSIWVASADERDTVQQEVQYSAAVEALDAAGLTSRSSNVLPSGEGLALALELGLPEEETISLSQLPTEALKTSQAQEDAARRKQADTAAAAAHAVIRQPDLIDRVVVFVLIVGADQVVGRRFRRGVSGRCKGRNQHAGQHGEAQQQNCRTPRGLMEESHVISLLFLKS